MKFATVYKIYQWKTAAHPTYVFPWGFVNYLQIWDFCSYNRSLISFDDKLTLNFF